MEGFPEDPNSLIQLSDDYFSGKTMQFPASASADSFSSSATLWTWRENKIFEKALVMFPEDTPNRWQMIADLIPDKSPAEVSEHYNALVFDVQMIESEQVPLVNYTDKHFVPGGARGHQVSEETQKSEHAEAEEKKGRAWTKREHQLFLIGLRKYGKSDWRNISRNVVRSKTPTQVASHAQKYFLRQESNKKERKRSSIHDITTVDSNLAEAFTDQIHFNQSYSVPIIQQPTPLPLLPPSPSPLLPQQLASTSYSANQGSLPYYQSFDYHPL